MSGRSTVLCQPPGPPPRRYLLLKLRETAEGREKAEGRPPPPAERARESPAPARERGSKKEREGARREGRGLEGRREGDRGRASYGLLDSGNVCMPAWQEGSVCEGNNVENCPKIHRAFPRRRFHSIRQGYCQKVGVQFRKASCNSPIVKRSLFALASCPSDSQVLVKVRSRARPPCPHSIKLGILCFDVAKDGFIVLCPALSAFYGEDALDGASTKSIRDRNLPDNGAATTQYVVTAQMPSKTSRLVSKCADV